MVLPIWLSKLPASDLALPKQSLNILLLYIYAAAWGRRYTCKSVSAEVFRTSVTVMSLINNCYSSLGIVTSRVNTVDNRQRRVAYRMTNKLLEKNGYAWNGDNKVKYDKTIEDKKKLKEQSPEAPFRGWVK